MVGIRIRPAKDAGTPQARFLLAQVSGIAHLWFLIFSGDVTLGAACLRSLQGRKSIPSAESYPELHYSNILVPALRKVREERGTRRLGWARELKTWASPRDRT